MSFCYSDLSGCLRQDFKVYMSKLLEHSAALDAVSALPPKRRQCDKIRYAIIAHHAKVQWKYLRQKYTT